ncbi:hypothetical protein [Streptomyces paromomycinus]|uniref:Uncharacterized protein n=1 Tax=Streptomyces paromomycinus TaxID=92743 RepID=A0A401W3J2_STREY|nr:hypothetical protein [Streptomyces paromomycinus]GCD43871.1 hypothetical protein GKJPGBOP_03557 [Streptomyces paromomycinus]
MRRVLLFLLAALLAFPVGSEGAYGRVAGAGAGAGGRAGTQTVGLAAPYAYAYEDGGPAETAGERCPTGRAARSATGIPTSRPGDQSRGANDPAVRPAAGPDATALVAGRGAAPLRRSGQLPISHRVFRC